MEAPSASPRASFFRRNGTVSLFLVGLLALDVAVGLFRDRWDRLSPDDYTARLVGCRERPRDFVFLGGSPVAEGLDPTAAAGFTWQGQTLRDGYALGLSGGTVSDFYHAAVHGCPAPPRVLVYGATASDWNDSRHEPHGPAALMTAGDLVGWVKLRPEAGGWVVRHFARGRLERASNLYRHRHAVRMWAAAEADACLPGCCPETALEARESRASGEALVAGNGYAPARGFERARFSDFKAAGATGSRFDSLHYLNRYRTGSHLKYLDCLADWCAANGASLVVLDMPVTADLERLYPAEFAEYRGRLAEVERARGPVVLRPSRGEIGLTDDQFADLIHLNRDGARRLSLWLRDRLSAVELPGAPTGERAPRAIARGAMPQSND